MQRLAIFAHFDRDGIIDDYVLYYLTGLKGLCTRILFVSDCRLEAAEIAKLRGLAEVVSAERHGEYDFGSWKRGFAFLGNSVSEWDEIVIANDSCYAPIYPFEGFFDKAQSVDCDWWGPTATIADDGSLCHMNSYFLAFRRPVLTNPAFTSFWRNVAAQPSQSDVIRLYEKGLTTLLVSEGFRWHAVVPPVPTPRRTAPVVFTEWVHDTLHRHRACWIKVRMIRDNSYGAARLSEALERIEGLYPRHLIDAHLLRMTGLTNPPHLHYPVPRVHSIRRRFKLIPGMEIETKYTEGNSFRLRFRLLGMRILSLPLPVRLLPRVTG